MSALGHGRTFALATDAAAEQQQRTFYNLSGKFVGRSSTNSSGTKTRSVADLDLDQFGGVQHLSSVEAQSATYLLGQARQIQ